MLCELWDDGRFANSFLSSLSEFGEGDFYNEVVSRAQWGGMSLRMGRFIYKCE